MYYNNVNKPSIMCEASQDLSQVAIRAWKGILLTFGLRICLLNFKAVLDCPYVDPRKAVSKKYAR